MAKIYRDDEPIADVERIALGPDDVVHIKVHSRINMADHARLSEHLSKIFPDNRLLITDNCDIAVVGEPVDVCHLPPGGDQILGAPCRGCGHTTIAHMGVDGCAVCQVLAAKNGATT